MKNWLIKYVISIKLGQIAMFSALYKRSVVGLLRQQLWLSRGDSLVLLSFFSNVEKFDTKHPMNGLHFRDIYGTLKQEVMRTENEEMV